MSANEEEVRLTGLIKEKIRVGKENYEFLKEIRKTPGLMDVYHDIDMSFKRAIIENKINEVEDILNKDEKIAIDMNPYQLAYYIYPRLELIERIKEFQNKIEYFKGNPDVNRCVIKISETEKELLGELYELANNFNMLSNKKTKEDEILKNAGLTTLGDFELLEEEKKKEEEAKPSVAASQSGGRKSRKNKHSRSRSKRSRTPRMISF